MVGAALRFGTLDLQSYRYDEAVTVGRVLQPNFFSTFSAVGHSESTPPLYYLLAWAWSQPFGTGEFWMRSLSALAGTGSIVVIYLAALALPLPRRAGLIAAALVAVSPVMVWFSQDARAYALVFLLTALSFLFFARARRGVGRHDLIWWAVFSAAGVRDALLRGLRRRRRGRRPAPRSAAAGSAGRRAGGRRRLGAADPGRPPPGRTQPRRLDRAAAAPPAPRTRRRQARRLRQRRRARHAPVGTDPAGGPGGPRLASLALLLWRGDGEERRGAGRRGDRRRRRRGGPSPAGGVRARLPRRPQPPARVRAADRAARRRLRGRGEPGAQAPPARWPCASARSSSPWRSTGCRDCNARTSATRRRRSARSARGPRWSPVATRRASRCATTSAPASRSSTPPPLREIDLVGSAAAARRAGRILPGRLPPGRIEAGLLRLHLDPLSRCPPGPGPPPRLGERGACRWWTDRFGAAFARAFGCTGSRALMLE